VPRLFAARSLTLSAITAVSYRATRRFGNTRRFPARRRPSLPRSAKPAPAACAGRSVQAARTRRAGDCCRPCATWAVPPPCRFRSGPAGPAAAAGCSPSSPGFPGLNAISLPRSVVALCSKQRGYGHAAVLDQVTIVAPEHTAFQPAAPAIPPGEDAISRRCAERLRANACP
jgi:hypothetical protein